MVKFKVGQKVVFKGCDWTAAKAGATAVVTGLGADFLSVKWVRNALSAAQSDGGYDYYKFKLGLQVGEQMEFDFMEEV